MKRTVRARIDIANPQWKLRPGMFVNAWLDVREGEGLASPAQCGRVHRQAQHCLRGQGRRTAASSSRHRTWENLRATSTPSMTASTLKSAEDLGEGEQVVPSANFLIDAESKIQGALKAWETEEPAPAPRK